MAFDVCNRRRTTRGWMKRSRVQCRGEMIIWIGKKNSFPDTSEFSERIRNTSHSQLSKLIAIRGLAGVSEWNIARYLWGGKQKKDLSGLNYLVARTSVSAEGSRFGVEFAVVRGSVQVDEVSVRVGLVSGAPGDEMAPGSGVGRPRLHFRRAVKLFLQLLANLSQANFQGKNSLRK